MNYGMQTRMCPQRGTLIHGHVYETCGLVQREICINYESPHMCLSLYLVLKGVGATLYGCNSVDDKDKDGL